MKHPALAGLVLAAAIAAAGCSTKALPKNLDEQKLREVRAQLAAGRHFMSYAPVEGTDLKHVQVYFVVDAPPERVWKVVTDYNYYDTFMPLMKRSKIRWNNERLVRLELEVGFPAMPAAARMVTALIHYPESHRVEWVYVEGDIEDTHGSWTLKPFGEGRTEVVYSYFLDMGGTMGGSFTQFGSGVFVPGLVDAIRKRVLDPRYDTLLLPEYARVHERKPSPIDAEFAAFD